MLNILHVTFDMRIGGTEMVIRNIIEGYDSKQFTMSIFCIEEPIGPWGLQLQKNGISVESTSRTPGFDIKLIKKLRQYIKRNKIDIVHCHQYTPWVYGTLAAAFNSTRVIFTEHGRFYPDSSSWKRRFINPLLVMGTNAITSISKATKQALIEFEFIPNDKITTIYNGIRPLSLDNLRQEETRKLLGIPDNHVVLGTVARFDPIKNHKMMLEAFSKVIKQHPNTTLIMVGDGEERDNIERMIGQYNLKDSVILTGYQTNPINFLAIMDIFLLSSLSEGTSMTLLEAMSLSKPCVVTDAGGNPEIILNGENGLVSPNGDCDKFAQAVNSLIKNGYKEFEVNARTRFDKYFSEQAMNLQFSELYRTLSND